MEMDKKIDFTLREGRNTTKLEKLIPWENIRTYLAIYRLMESINIRPYEAINPIPEFKRIQKNVNVLKRRGLLPSDAAKEIIGILFKNLTQTEEGKKCLASFAAKGRGAPGNMALNFLIYALVQDARHFTKRPQFPLIAGFLEEQDIREEEQYLSQEVVSKRYERSKKRVSRYLKVYAIADDRFIPWLGWIISSENPNPPRGDLLPSLMSAFASSK